MVVVVVVIRGHGREAASRPHPAPPIPASRGLLPGRLRLPTSWMMERFGLALPSSGILEVGGSEVAAGSEVPGPPAWSGRFPTGQGARCRREYVGR